MFDFRGKKYLLYLFDTAGQVTAERSLFLKNRISVIYRVAFAFQDEYSLFPRSYTVGMHGYVLVYAINNRKSFDVVKVIYDKILDSAGQVDSTGQINVPLILVGNKLDLQHVEREVSTDEGRKLAEKWKAGFLETSAKDYQVKCYQSRLHLNVKSLFERMLFQIEKAYGNIQEKNGSTCCVS
ncbi:unnamed protein product [Soboliphyme baturini]|uniref:GTP-binding Rheb n=1 Tax=Soboliphyme baturini TaxID=241478 RepID=A0A183IJS1_9BILA|nr:unnamed protein product [Soboliphyme baturini]